MPFFLINVFNGKFVAQPFWIPQSAQAQYNQHSTHCTFTVNRNFKASPAARSVSALNAVSKTTDIFNKDCIQLTDISQLS